MTVTLSDAAGRTYVLPPLFSWRVSHGVCAACDDFEILCAYDPSQAAAVKTASRMLAEYGGARVFTGVVDEWTVTAGADGFLSRLTGRGLQALLLDNEAAPAQFAHVSWRDIAARYVTPLGVVCENAELPGLADFRVESGESIWRVAARFLEGRRGVYSRFLPDGRLAARRYDPATRAVRTADLSVQGADARFSYNRYGVVAGVTVRNRDTLQSYTVKNPDYAGPEGRKLVTTGVGRDGVALMEERARVRMRESLLSLQTVRLTLPGAFAAWPGEAVELKNAPPAFAGRYGVRQAETAADGHTLETRLWLTASSNF